MLPRMSRSPLSFLGRGVIFAAVLLFTAGTAAAQGTMTPSQPPTDTPEPPVVQPEPVQSQLTPTPPAPPPPVGPAEGGEKPEAPKARTGFQMAVRTGVA